MGRHLAPSSPETHSKNLKAIATANYAYPATTGLHAAPHTVENIAREVEAIEDARVLFGGIAPM